MKRPSREELLALAKADPEAIVVREKGNSPRMVTFSCQAPLPT